MQVQLQEESLNLAVLQCHNPLIKSLLISGNIMYDQELVRKSQYCNDWCLAGPIIEENKITIYVDTNAFDVGLDLYIACINLTIDQGWDGTEETIGDAACFEGKHSQRGKTMLEAAMRCFLSIKGY